MADTRTPMQKNHDNGEWIIANHWEAGATTAVLIDHRLTEKEQTILAEWFSYLYDKWRAKKLVMPPEELSSNHHKDQHKN